MNANGGGFVTNNSLFNMRWHNQDIDPGKTIYWEYSTNNSTWTRINQTAVPVTANYMSWFVQTGLQNAVWLRAVQETPDVILTKSPTPFIVTDKTLNITYPVTGSDLVIESEATITWLSSGCTNLILDYTTDFGLTWQLIAPNVPSAQLSYLWLVPNTPSHLCRIRLRDITLPNMRVENSGEFSIIPGNFNASFTAYPTSGYSDLEVQFTDTSVGDTTSWSWDFNNDGITDSSLQNPVWVYRQSGYHSVALTISDGVTQSTVTRNSYIYVYPMTAEFTASETSGYLPFTVQYNDLTLSDVSQWQWDFDSDGMIDADYQNPFWTYLFPGTYTVTQTVSNGLESDTEIKTNYITVSLDPVRCLFVPAQYLTIQAAINASVDGDYIIVADGIYYENLVIEGKNITLASYYFIDGDSTHIANTIIDGSQALNPDQASTLTILPSGGRPVSSPHIVGFTIRNGAGRKVIQNIGSNTIEKRVGGGIYIRQSNPLFTFNRIEDNDADDEGGGSYAFQSLPNFGGMVNASVGIVNPGNNTFSNNHADLGADIYIYGVTTRDAIKLENCGFEVFSVADTTVSNYWANSSTPLSFVGCNGDSAALTGDLYVATNGSDAANNGLSASSPFKTIDHALSRIYATESNPLTIHIASGTYSPSLTGELFPLQLVRYVSLVGAGEEETFLDAEANVDFPKRVINLDNVQGVFISNLTLMGGFVTLSKNYNGGGVGIMNSDLKIMNVLITSNSSAGNGAGVYAYNSSVEIDSVSAEYNAALGSGGGIHSINSELRLSNSSVLNNSVNKNGAGIFADNGRIAILNCEIQGNQAGGSQSKGGGISISGADSTLIANNLIRGNNADNGAGIYLQSNSNLRIDRNRIINNLADYNGGGIFINTTTGKITNNLIANNTASQRGGAVYSYSSLGMINNTIVNNKANLQGGGLYLNTGSPAFSNTILWGNAIGAGNILNQLHIYTDAADPDFGYCNVQGGQTSFTLDPGVTYSGNYQNNLNAPPLFTDPTPGPGHTVNAMDAVFTLQDLSPCIDAGNPDTDVSDIPLDLVGNPRLDNNRIDMGAYEQVHYNGARVEANPAALDFGRVNLSAEPVVGYIILTNFGNQALKITNLSFESSPAVFFWSYGQLEQDIEPGHNTSIAVSFDPSSVGSFTNSLIIANNSLNQGSLTIPLSGTGIDASTSVPGNVTLSIVGDDVHLSWNPVLSDPEGNPFTPDGYVVLYSEQADVDADSYYYLDSTAQTCFVHQNVARFRPKMFYLVIAIDSNIRASLKVLSSNYRRNGGLKWKDIRMLSAQRIVGREK